MYQQLGITPGMFVLQEVNQNFILKQLQQMNANKSTGLDDISPRFLHDGAQPLASIVCHLVNLSIRSKTVPTCIKSAKVTPIF